MRTPSTSTTCPSVRSAAPRAASCCSCSMCSTAFLIPCSSTASRVPIGPAWRPHSIAWSASASLPTGPSVHSRTATVISRSLARSTSTNPCSNTSPGFDHDGSTTAPRGSAPGSSAITAPLSLSLPSPRFNRVPGLNRSHPCRRVQVSRPGHARIATCKRPNPSASMSLGEDNRHALEWA